MELSGEGEDYNMYSVPILVNGEDYTLRVVYDFTAERYEILGDRKDIDEYEMVDRDNESSYSDIFSYVIVGDDIYVQ